MHGVRCMGLGIVRYLCSITLSTNVSRVVVESSAVAVRAECGCAAERRTATLRGYSSAARWPQPR
jgi:hypothetical protein